MRILVTGAAGFLGSHLCDRLLADGHHVTALDNLDTGSKANLPAGVEFIFADVCGAFVRRQYDRVYHLACPASPPAYQRDPVHTIDTCVMGTRQALKCAREQGARILLASTSEVYGDPTVHPQPEWYHGNVSPIGPRSMYDEGKRCAEAIAVAWAQQYGTPVRIARIFNTYGPRMQANDGRLLPNFITQAMRGDALTVYGDGSQTRSLCYVSDMVEGFVRLMESDVEGPVNLGNPDERTVLSIAEDVRRMLGGTIAHKPLPQDDPRQRCPDITRARTLLGWEPRVLYEEGLARTIEWFAAKAKAA